MTRAPLLLLAALGASACSPTPGRPPAYPDAAADAEPMDAPPPEPNPDASVYDGGPSDIATVFPDAGNYPFTGLFGVPGIGPFPMHVLFAREVDGKVNLLVDTLPYNFFGTITPDGQVTASSDLLERIGCAGASLTGNYDRSTAFYSLQYQACNAQGQTFSTNIHGAFGAAFAPGSGVYQVAAAINLDNSGCYQGPQPIPTLTWAVNFLPGSNNLQVYTAEDLIAQPALYTGNYDTMSLQAATLERVEAQPSGNDVALTGQIVQITANMPPSLNGVRDVFDFNRNCGFRIQFQAVWTSGP
jgi:hypothetical protein